MPPSTIFVVRTVQRMSNVHKVCTALWRRDVTIHKVLETTIFTPTTFPRVLSLSISFGFLDFLRLFRGKHTERRQLLLGHEQQIMNATTTTTTTSASAVMTTATSRNLLLSSHNI
jgi:hypothetical protein